MTECSSQVMTLPHSRAAFSTSSSSRGLMEAMLTIRALMPSSFRAPQASTASAVIRPVEMMATSVPSRSTSPLPIWKE